jgi:hypothetical protein
MRRVLSAVWAVLLAGLLASAGLLGFAAARGAVDAGLHGVTGVVAAALAIGSHVRRGGGWDLLAVVGLLAAVGLGTFTEAGSTTATLHVAAAVPATLLSAGLHVLGGVSARPRLTGQTRK